MILSSSIKSSIVRVYRHCYFKQLWKNSNGYNNDKTNC